MAIDENKQKALAAALGQIEKQFGKGSIMRLGEDRSWMWKPSLPVRFHWISRLGQVVCRWAVSSNYGPESSGKTTLTLQVIAAAQREGKPVRLSMLNTRWTQSTHVNWASISTTCCAPSRTPASRHWKSVTPWRVLAQ